MAGLAIMADVAQLVELQIVVLAVAGSSPVVRPSAASVVELVDTPDLGSGAARCRGSSPFARTLYR